MATDENAARFDALLGEVTSGQSHFGHREHVHLTWAAIRRYGQPAALELINSGIRRVATYAGRPQKYHATISRAWVEAVGHHAEADPTDDFDEFAMRNRPLLDKRLLSRFYESRTLASPAARTGWVEPDREPFPWRD